MDDRRTLELPQSEGCSRSKWAADPTSHCYLVRADCLEQLLLAFRDIADHDDIHQAAGRLALVQEWIRGEAERAARDPIFATLHPI
jgi:hypothetical protein